VLRAEGAVVHGGSRVASAEAKLVAADGALHAHATSSWLILSAEPKDAQPLAA
jgi:acyl-coenzyme A thioesterase PaaI-like protein